MSARRRKGKPAPPRGRSYDPDIPVAGYYQIKLRKGGPPVALRFWFGPPVDRDTLETLDRSPGWFCTINGADVVEAAYFWPECARQPISIAEYHRISRLSRTLDRASPFYDPLRPIDRLRAPMPF
jgi:hypothetical protein